MVPAPVQSEAVAGQRPRPRGEGGAPGRRSAERRQAIATARTVAFLQARTLNDRITTFAALTRWIWSARSDREFNVRLARWLAMLEEEPALRVSVRSAFGEMLDALHSVSLLADAGLPRQHALLQEAVRRVLQRMLPSVRQECDTTRLLLLVFTSPADVGRFLALPEQQFAPLADLLMPAEGDGHSRKLQDEVGQALRLLATRVSSRGLSPAMRERGSGGLPEESPFYLLLFRTEALLEARERAPWDEQLREWNGLVSKCRDEMEQVHLHMERAGVSSDLVFDLKTIELALHRMCALMEALASSAPAERVGAIRRLLEGLVVAQMKDTRLSALLRENLNLLARKTVERTGHGGEHYIAHSRSEYWLMWRAALGGGLLTVLTAAIKMRIVATDLPPFIEGFLSGTNYAVSFILLQVFGLVLATKQPSMTAATFAGIVRHNRGQARWSKIADFVAAITRSQLAAALGNILAVVVGAMAFERFWQRLFRVSYLPVSTARNIYQTLHPFTSGTAIFAILTGVILWLAALIGGWFENFAVYHRLTDALREHPFGRRLGQQRLSRVADILERDLAGWSTSIALGYLLGFTPVVASFFGIPLDVRHVTLTTGTLALAAGRFGTRWFGHDWLWWAVAGIAVTFVLNLSVSFSIAAYVALRAYDVPRQEQWQLLKFLLRDMLRSPLKFLVPVRETAAGSRLRPAELIGGE